MKILPAPQLKPIDKDSVIEDLKRKLLATEYQLDLYKSMYAEESKSHFKTWCELQELKGESIDK